MEISLFFHRLTRFRPEWLRAGDTGLYSISEPETRTISRYGRNNMGQKRRSKWKPGAPSKN